MHGRSSKGVVYHAYGCTNRNFYRRAYDYNCKGTVSDTVNVVWDVQSGKKLAVELDKAWETK